MHGGGVHGVEREDEFLSVAHARRLGVIPRDACGTGVKDGQPAELYLVEEVEGGGAKAAVWGEKKKTQTQTKTQHQKSLLKGGDFI